MKILNSITLVFLLGCSLFQSVYAQSGKPLFSIGQERHYSEEFNYAYAKNNIDTQIKQDSIDAYLELYINFRLKVKEAKVLGYDTTKAFVAEFELYKNQLEEAYISPKKEQEALIREAYDRSLWEIRASHILITVPKEATGADTLNAYKKIAQIRQRVLAGEKFSELATTLSDDPSAKQNGGDLGYFSVFQMVYPFENAAYATAVGNISNPIRTQFGYHIITVVEKRANEGKVRVAHIMIRSTDKNGNEFKAEAKKKAFYIDSLVQNGGNWNELCQKYSEDQNSLAKNGEIKPFGRGEIVPEFEQAAFKLKNNNDISLPIKTQFGWHIIKLIDRIPVGSFKEEQSKLARKIKSDARSSMPRAEMLKTLKEVNKFYRNEEAANKILQTPSSVAVNGQWRFDSVHLTNAAVLFTLPNVEITVGTFYKSITNNSFDKRLGVKQQLQKQLINYEDSLVISYEKQHLSLKHPEYKFLVQEYYDGILLFSIMEDSVWNLSMSDSIGLTHYYEENKMDYAKSVIDTTIFSSRSDSELVLAMSTTEKSMDRKEWDELKTLLLEKNSESPLTLQIISTEASNRPLILEANVNELVEIENTWYWVKVADIVEYPELNTIKGRVISDYQHFLDEKWIKSLKKKYPVKINKKSLNKVYEYFKAVE